VLAREYGIMREASDAYAVETQRRAARAIAEGRFRDEIAPVTVTDAKGRNATVDADEHPRPDTTLESLKKLGPVFPKVEGQPGIITAGTSSSPPASRSRTVTSGVSARRRATTDPDEPEPQTMKS